MAPTEDTASTGRRRRRVAVGAVLALLLVAGAIALGVVYSNKGRGSSANGTQQDGLAPDSSSVAKVLDALKNMVSGDAAAPSTDAATTTVVTPVTANKDGVLDGASNMAGPAPAPAPGANAPAPGPQGLIQAASAAAYNSLGMKVCTPNNGAEFVSLRGCVG